MSGFVRGATLSNYLEVAAQLGLDPNAMLREVGIDRRALADPDLRLPAGKVVALLERSAAESGCLTFGLQMAESRRVSDFGAVSLLIAHQATMRDALLTIVEFRQLVNEALVIHVEEHPEIVIIREELLVHGQGQMRQAYELAVGVIYRMFRAQLGPRWRALSVSFVHGPPPDLAVHRRIFGPIVEFGGDFNGLTCSQADLGAPNASADPAMARFAERFVRSLPNADRQTLSHDVQKAIHLLLPVRGASIGQVAGVLGLNERTLQRKLAAEGADFSQLLDQVRRDLVQRYLGAAHLPMSRIAQLIGYATQSSFNRWFAEAFGVSPSSWRKTAAHTHPAKT